MRKSISILFLAFLFSTPLMYAQKSQPKFKFGDVKPEDFASTAYGVDSSAGAVYLSDIGTTNFVGNKSRWFDHVFKHYARIRILNKTGYDAATWKIDLRRSGSRSEELSDVKCATYNLENGKVVKTDLDAENIFEDNIDNHRTEKKFTLPAIKEGSIIEVSYTITSPFYNELQPWLFQNTDYPRLWSEYQVGIPETLNYFFIKQGLDLFFMKDDRKSYEQFYMDGITVSTNVNYHHWVMQNVPALKIENYITTPENYVDKIEFQLASTYNGESLDKYFTDWNSAAQYLLEESNFGMALQEDVNAREIDKAANNASDILGEAKAIYYSIKDHYTCSNHYSFYVNSTLQNVIQNKKGNVGEINLLLINRLRKFDITADPVILSRRSVGFSYSKYPLIDKFNYLICRTIIKGNTYYLDAANPDLGFGKLENDCYNGEGMVISSNSEAINFSADSLNDPEQTTVFLFNGDKGLEGSYTSNKNYMESLELRNKISDDKEADFFKDIQKNYNVPVEISNTSIDGLRLPENPVSIKYDMKLGLGDDNILYFNPMLNESNKENPFKAETRLYPVEMPYCTDKTYILNMEIPKGYAVDELPKSARVNLNESDGSFEYIIAKSDNNIQLRCRLKLNKANFAPDDYQTLRDFFTFIVKKEAEQIVFKKL